MDAGISKPPAGRATLGCLDELHRRIEEMAARSRWADVEALVRERNALLADFSGEDRARALAKANESTERILALATSARLELSGDLAKLRKGREATRAYRAHG